MTNTLTIKATLLPGIDFLVIRKDSNKNRFFFTGSKEFAIPMQNLSILLVELVKQGVIDKSFLEDILEECREKTNE